MKGSSGGCLKFLRSRFLYVGLCLHSLHNSWRRGSHGFLHDDGTRSRPEILRRSALAIESPQSRALPLSSSFWGLLLVIVYTSTRALLEYSTNTCELRASCGFIENRSNPCGGVYLSRGVHLFLSPFPLVFLPKKYFSWTKKLYFQREYVINLFVLYGNLPIRS